MATLKVRCPVCGKRSEYNPQNAFRPFCSERCKLVDLGAWASNQYAIAGKEASPDDAIDQRGTSGESPSNTRQ
jgi:uncharacterized protein